MIGSAAAVVGSGPAADPEAPYVRLAVVAIVREPAEGRWLLIRAPRGPESWGPPGGRVERGESLADALHRELMEEVGLRVLTGGPCFAYVTMHKGERTVGVHMACRSIGGRSAGVSGSRGGRRPSLGDGPRVGGDGARRSHPVGPRRCGAGDHPRRRIAGSRLTVLEIA